MLSLCKENFKGTILHSVQYKNPSQWKGKAGVIIGSANTGQAYHSTAIGHDGFADHFRIAHDVAEDMLEAGLSSVTMVQRGRTCTFHSLC